MSEPRDGVTDALESYARGDLTLAQLTHFLEQEEKKASDASVYDVAARERAEANVARGEAVVRRFHRL